MEAKQGAQAEALERWVRRWTAAGWLTLSGMALHGAWRGWRHPRARVVGRPLRTLPRWLLAVLGVPYVILLVVLWRPLPLALPSRARLAAAVSGGLLSGLGLGLSIWGRFALGEMYNVSSALGAELYAGHRLITGGPFAVVRHPVYLGAAVAAAGALLVYRTWAVVFILMHLPIFVARARREEQALAAQFGPTWEAYRRRVPAWLPRQAWPG
jgi:protein-S-isoprenylcysteine O-methyltransferase Ste14